MDEVLTWWEVWRVDSASSTGYGDSAWAKGWSEEEAKQQLAVVRDRWPEKVFESHKIVITREKLPW